MNTRIILLLLFSIGFSANAQILQKSFKLNWQAAKTIQIDKNNSQTSLSFDGAVYQAGYGNLPVFSEIMAVSNGNAKAELSNLVFEPVPTSEFSILQKNTTITNEIQWKNDVAYFKKQPQLQILILPYRKNNNQFERLKSFTVKINYSNLPTNPILNKIQATNTSVLAAGKWQKLAVFKDGVYKITRNQLEQMGFDIANINPKYIQIYGNGGGMLPQPNATARIDDLAQNAIFVSGENDGSFDENDYILFYGESPHQWEFNLFSDRYQHEYNDYAERNFYFITIGTEEGKRIENQAINNNPADYTSTSFDDFAFHETNDHNLINSGREWYGEIFDIELSHSFNFSFPNRITSQDIILRTVVAARSSTASNNFIDVIETNSGNNLLNIALAQVNTSYYLATFAAQRETAKIFTSSNQNISLTYTYRKPNVFAKAWLNYLELNVRRELKMAGDQMIFQDKESLNHSLSQYNLSNLNPNIRVWEITNPTEASAIASPISNGNMSFKADGTDLRKFIAFNNANHLVPEIVGEVKNQNLHGISNVDMIILTHNLFKTQAQELADFHAEKSNLSVEVITPAQIYNEFSSGKQDVSAIRDFMKMLYDRAATAEEMPKYLLLFGDASFDYKNKLPNNTNFVPTYESPGSLNPLASYPSDAYFGVLDDSEGRYKEGDVDKMDVAIGRLPVHTVEQAETVVGKIKQYASSESHGDWRNIISIIADDQDTNLHLNQAQSISGTITTAYPLAIIDKIYCDAYQQVSTPGGSRYPDVNRAINDRFNKGALVISYIGHGGGKGFAEERILTHNDINSWRNFENMPVMVTATCELSKYDDPTEISAGEAALFHQDGGAIAMLTTVRTTFADDNFRLSTVLYRDNLFKKTNGEYPTLGEACMGAMNPTLSSINTRCFTLLGDPALRMAYPKENIAITKINDIDVTSISDTIKALQKVTLKGIVIDQNNQKISDFNGIVYPTVYDKASRINTLVNDPIGSERSLPATFSKLENIIYKGKASVTNGDFSFTFIVPKDISYNYDFGRISLYADDGQIDAAGFYDSLMIGGSAFSIASDNQGPEIELFMNDTKFVTGGITDENPLLLALVSDSSGINTVGNGIGHDITAIIDEKSDQSIILNDFYEAKLNSFTQGEVRYPFSQLEQGPHTLTFKVWDVFNNSSEAMIEFIVSDAEDFTIKNLLNYPNPFTTNTTFHFDHNRPGEAMQAQIQVFSMNGSLVKTIQGDIQSNGFHENSLTWNGLDEFGDQIGRGVYVYKLKIRTASGDYEEVVQKLVLLR